MLMKHRDHNRDVLSAYEVRRVRKLVKQCTSHSGADFRKLIRERPNPIHRTTDLLGESHPKPFVFAPVPGSSLLNVDFGKPRGRRPGSCLPALLQQICLDVLPGSVRLRVCFEIRKPFVEHLTVPVGDRNALILCGNPVPEGLDVVDLLPNLEIIEPRWRYRQLAASHGSFDSSLARRFCVLSYQRGASAAGHHEPLARRPQALVGRRGSRYSTGMKLAFELPPAQADRLREEAKRLGLAPEDLARAALADLLGTPDAEFRAAAARVLQKNQELYRRLA